MYVPAESRYNSHVLPETKPDITCVEIPPTAFSFPTYLHAHNALNVRARFSESERRYAEGIVHRCVVCCTLKSAQQRVHCLWQLVYSNFSQHRRNKAKQAKQADTEHPIPLHKSVRGRSGMSLRPSMSLTCISAGIGSERINTKTDTME